MKGYYSDSSAWTAQTCYNGKDEKGKDGTD
jgi:hypothetical protein